MISSSRATKARSEDRMRFFAEELFETILKPAVFPGAYELIEKSRSIGLRQVVVTGASGLVSQAVDGPPGHYRTT